MKNFAIVLSASNTQLNEGYKNNKDRWLCYLAINTGSSISTSSTYILFLTEMQKRQTR